MRFGNAPITKLPKQDSDRLLLMADRYARALPGHTKWAEQAKRCVDFFEGRQWSDMEKLALEQRGRRAFTFNIIAPLVRLILGYQSNNKSDITFQPGNDSLSSEEVAKALTQIEKSVAIMNKLPYVDTTVFLDGILTGRGYYRTLLDFKDNDLGETLTRAADPFDTIIDPDADTYDLNESASFTQVRRWLSLDEIEANYGRLAREQLRGWAHGQTPIAPLTTLYHDGEVSPVRAFSGEEDGRTTYWDNFHQRMGDFFDPYRKTLRVLETEHWVSEERYVAVDLETGDKKTLPAHWGKAEVDKISLWGEVTGNPLLIQKRMVRIVHWTTTCADMILHDKPSPYGSYSLTPFFPYFRRGTTRSPIEDMLDPQLEKNKRRTAEIEIVSQTAAGGWEHHEDSLNPRQKARLHRYGSTPGFVLEWKGTQKPTRLEPAAPPMAHERLEQKADEDLRKITGINEAALGETSNERSGRAIEAKQRQAVISLQVYLDNFRLAKELLGNKRLELYQSFYTEPRIYRIMGEDGKFAQAAINQRNAGGVDVASRIVNDVTLGKYSCVVDEQPLSATFANAQYEDQQAFLEKLMPFIGPALPAFADLMFESSSFPNKSEWVDRMRQVGLTPPAAVPIDPNTGQPIAMPGQPMPGQPVLPGAAPAPPALPAPAPAGIPPAV